MEGIQFHPEVVREASRLHRTGVPRTAKGTGPLRLRTARRSQG
jgi:hypothetical protein